MSWRSLEDKVNRKRLNQLNVPYEKERLKQEIENFDTKIGKAINNTMKSINASHGNNDPALRALRMRQQRLKNILVKLEDLEASYNEKLHQAQALKYEEELSNELEHQRLESCKQEVTEEQKLLLEQITKLQKL